MSTAPDGTLQVRTTGNQGSGVLSSMVQANGLIVLHHEQGNVAVGDEVDVMMFTSSHQVTNLMLMAQRLNLSDELLRGISRAVVALPESDVCWAAVNCWLLPGSSVRRRPVWVVSMLSG